MSKKLVYGGAVIVAILIVVLLALQEKVSWNDLGVALLALLGTFFGALFAFRLDEKKDLDKETSRRKSALNRALLVLGAQMNEIRVIHRELKQFPMDSDCACNMNAAQPVNDLGLAQKIDDLDFLLETENPHMLFALHIEQIRFDQALESVRIRNKHCVEQLQPELAKHDLRGKPMNDVRLRQLLGELIYETAVGTVAGMRHHISESEKSIEETAKELRTLAKKLYPDTKFIHFTPVEPNPQYDPRKRTD